MRVNRPKKGQDWLPFFGCERFPKCRGTVQAVLRDPEQMMFWDKELDWLKCWVYD